MVQWKEDWPAYWATVDELKKSNCGVVGIDSAHFQLEYPLEALLREARPGVLFVHAGVTNASARYRAAGEQAALRGGVFALRGWGLAGGVVCGDVSEVKRDYFDAIACSSVKRMNR